MTQTQTRTPTIPTDTDAFLVELVRQEVAPKTATSYRADLTHFATWFVGSTGEAFAAAAVTPTDLRDYRGYLVTVERRAPATINRRLAALRKFFTWALATRRVSELPTLGVKGVASAPRSPKALEKREVDRLIRMAEHSKNKRDLAILQLLRHTGIRVGELAALRLSDIEISERKGTLTVRQGKGGKFRQIPLNVDVRRALESYLDVRPETVDDHLFIGQRGEGLKPQAVENVVKKYARRAGLVDVTPHTLRHSFGKGLLAAGVDLVTVAALLGHERLETTAIYTQPSARDLERAVERLSLER